jgi:hypothetical protein
MGPGSRFSAGTTENTRFNSTGIRFSTAGVGALTRGRDLIDAGWMNARLLACAGHPGRYQPESGLVLVTLCFVDIEPKLP